MEFTEKDLDNLATLSRIYIKEEEKPKLLSQMKAILNYVSEIQVESRKSKVESQYIKTETNFNIVREDVITRNGENRDAILANAPERDGDYVKVSQVLK